MKANGRQALRITHISLENWRNFSRADVDLGQRVFLVGPNASGKSTLLLGMIKQDLESGQGLCVLDPHGDLIDDVIKHIPDSRIDDVILFDPSDADCVLDPGDAGTGLLNEVKVIGEAGESTSEACPPPPPTGVP